MKNDTKIIKMEINKNILRKKEGKRGLYRISIIRTKLSIVLEL